jgi:hypothetical protein
VATLDAVNGWPAATFSRSAYSSLFVSTPLAFDASGGVGGNGWTLTVVARVNQAGLLVSDGGVAALNSTALGWSLGSKRSFTVNGAAMLDGANGAAVSAASEDLWHVTTLVVAPLHAEIWEDGELVASGPPDVLVGRWGGANLARGPAGASG